MLEPKDEVIDEMKFNFSPLPALVVLKLDKKIISLLAPALGGLDKISLDTKIDLKVISQGIGNALASLNDEETERFILNLFSTTTHVPEDGKTQPQVISKEVFDDIFRLKIQTVYKLAFAVMKYNKFSPFGLVAGGNVMNKIRTSLEKTKKEKKNGNKLEK